MHRFYSDSDVLSAEDAHHALNVLRLSVGDEVELITDGCRYRAVLDFVASGEVRLARKELLASTEPSLSVTLFQGLPKGDKMDWIVQKAVELGIAEIVPVSLSRCIVRLDEKGRKAKTERWQKIAREAGKQSGRCVIPRVHMPVSLQQLPACFASLDAVVVPWEECPSGGPLSFFRLHENLSSLGILIGPEGGITPDEIQFLLRCNAQPITLGKRILRTETAGLAAVSALFGLYGEME